MERRSIERPAKIETRADGAKVLSGYAAVFHRQGDPGTEYELWRGCVERIAPGAFARAIKERHDVRGLANHEPSQLLGRLPAGTLRLVEDTVGLRYEIDLPDTQIARDVAVSIERGDLTGSSFAFRATVVQWTEEADIEVRTLVDLDLYDVGPVTYPAYAATTAGLRSDGDDTGAKAERDAWRAEQRRISGQATAIAIRARMAEIDSLA